MNEQVQNISNEAKRIRKDIVEMVYLAKDGHPGPALSITDIIASLYFDIMKIDPKNSDWSERDRFILSKGHACPALYSALSRKGYYSPEILPELRSFGSMVISVSAVSGVTLQG